MVNQNKLRKVKKIQAKTIKNNLGQNTTLLSQLLCRRTMVGKVVGLRRAKIKHNKTSQDRTRHHRIAYIKPSPLPIKAEYNSLQKQSKTQVKTTYYRLTALQVAIAIKKIIAYYRL